MEEIFATKRDANGNRCHLLINHKAKRFYWDYFAMVHASDITATVTKKKLREMRERLIENGYKEVLKLH